MVVIAENQGLPAGVVQMQSVFSENRQYIFFFDPAVLTIEAGGQKHLSLMKQVTETVVTVDKNNNDK